MSEQPTSNLGTVIDIMATSSYLWRHRTAPLLICWVGNQDIFRGQVIGGFHVHKVSPRLIPFVLPQAFLMKHIPHSQFSLESQENLISGQMKVYSSLDV